MRAEIPGLAIVAFLSAVLLAAAGPALGTGILAFWGCFATGVAVLLRLVSPTLSWWETTAHPDAEAFPVLDEEDVASRAKWGRDPHHRLACLLSLQARLGSSELACQVFVAALHDPSPVIRLLAARKCPPTPCRRDTLVRLLYCDDELIACDAIAELVASEGAAAQAHLLFLADRHRGTRGSAALRALGQAGTVAAIEPLRRIGSAAAFAAVHAIQARMANAGSGQLSLASQSTEGALSLPRDTGALTLCD